MWIVAECMVLFGKGAAVVRHCHFVLGCTCGLEPGGSRRWTRGDADDGLELTTRLGLSVFRKLSLLQTGPA